MTTIRLLSATLACAAALACGDDNGTDNPDGNTGNTMSATIDGTAFTANSSVQATNTSGDLVVTGSSTNNRSITIAIPQVTQTGIYDAGPGFAAVVTYTLGQTNYLTSLQGGTGTVTISTISATRVAGSFAVTTVGSAGAVGTRVLTNGKFDVRF